MKRTLSLTAVLLLILVCGSFAQDTKTACKAEFQAGVDLMSRYVWRGLNLGGAGPSIQPNLKLNIGTPDHNFSIGAWGAYTFSATANQEVDFFVSYTYKSMFTVMVTDYFFPDLYTDQRDKYFYYAQDSTGHVFEGCLMFNGTEKIPFTLMVATNFYGNDAKRMKEVNDTTFAEDGLQYSTYIELGFKKNIKGFDFNAFVGGTVNNPDEDLRETGFYSNTKAGFTNVGIKVAKGIPITEKYSLPVQVSLIANPMQSKFYIVFGLTI